MSIANLIKNAEVASNALKEWTKYPNGVPYFHLRPTSSGVTLMSTHPDKLFRGIEKIASSRGAEMLEIAANSVNKNKTDWDSVVYKKKTGEVSGFKVRSQASLDKKEEKENVIQAWMINELVKGNTELCKRFNADRLYFLGSEVILQEGTTSGGQKIDIVAHDGKGRILFLELKNIDNEEDGVEQVKGYLNTYSKNKDFMEFLLNYPCLPPVNLVKSYEGWAVRGDCDSLNIKNLIVTRVKQ
jgi:hypothetical protein